MQRCTRSSIWNSPCHFALLLELGLLKQCFLFSFELQYLFFIFQASETGFSLIPS